MRILLPVVVLLTAHLGGCAATTASSPSADPSPTATLEPSPSPSPSGEAALGSPGEPTPVPNDQQGVASEHGLFVGSWSTDPGTPPINVLHEWILHIETADGAPVQGALVTVDGDMPAHGHGMPTLPEVTADLGGGDYRVEGMEFQMGGYWIVDVTVTSADQTDTIRFGLELADS
jgi:YtkA-like protein